MSLSTIASHSPLNISETVRDRGLLMVLRTTNSKMAYGESNFKWSRDRWRNV